MTAQVMARERAPAAKLTAIWGMIDRKIACVPLQPIGPTTIHNQVDDIRTGGGPLTDILIVDILTELQGVSSPLTSSLRTLKPPNIVL